MAIGRGKCELMALSFSSRGGEDRRWCDTETASSWYNGLARDEADQIKKCPWGTVMIG